MTKTEAERSTLSLAAIAVRVAATSLMVAAAASLGAVPAFAQALPEADIIFVVDESGSMGDEQASLQANIIQVANDLAASTDGRYGLVGYGASNPTPVTEQPLTDDLTAFATAVGGLTINGATEPGYDATIHALTDPAIGLRSTAGTCIVLATDEPSNGDAATAQEAIDALAVEGAFFFGLVQFNSTTPPSYQPLADASGGALFDLDAFNTDPAGVLNALLTTCVESIVASSGGKVTGGGRLDIDDGSVSFGTVAMADEEGARGNLQVNDHVTGARFHGSTVDILFALENTASWSGEGRWNGEEGYRFEITVVDNRNGNSKKKGIPDTVDITIRDAFDAVIWSTGGPVDLTKGNVVVH